MVRTATTRRRALQSKNARRGRCVICGVEGRTRNDFVCGDCGDPLDTTLYCERCGRRLGLQAQVAESLLQEYGFGDRDIRGLVFKVTACSRCMTDDEIANVALYRVRMGSKGPG